MESYGTNGDSNLTFNGTLNAATNSTGAYRLRVETTPERMVESIVSVIRGLQETTAALTFLIRNNLALMIPESDDELEGEEDEDDEQGILPSETEIFLSRVYLREHLLHLRLNSFIYPKNALDKKVTRKEIAPQMESSNANAENSTFSGTLNASANSTPANMPIDGSIQSHIEEVQVELGQSGRASAEFLSNQEDVNHSSHAEFCLVCQRVMSGSSTLNSLLEHTHELLPANAGGGERTADVVDSSTQTMIPESEGELEEERENDGQDPTIDNELLLELELYEHMRNVIAALRHTTFPLCLKLHKYDSSTCLESEEQCCICLDEYWDGEELAKIDCGHVYHIVCIKDWIKIENSCPICRRLAMAH